MVALVNAGALEAAESLVEEADWAADPAASPADRFHDALSLLFVLGMLALNHRADYPAAARSFRRVFEACRAVPSGTGAAALLWPARYHEALALSHGAELAQAQEAALDLLAPGDTRLPEVPAAYRDWARELVAR